MSGTIVALKDEQEHLYLAVEEILTRDGQYHLVSVMHYSLAGRRALFKVWSLFSVIAAVP